MEICSLVNSKDIGEYLKDINYQFDSLEAAWLIFACRKLNFEKKKKLWLELIASMPDLALPEKMACKSCNSLHDFLKRYIAIIDQEKAEFYKEKQKGEYVYMYSYLYQGDGDWTEEYKTIYPSLAQCLEAYKKDVADLDETYSPEGTGVLRYRLKRQGLEDTGDVLEIECDAQGNLIDILNNFNRTDEDSNVVVFSFDTLWFDFPTPFKKGDIVWAPADKNSIRRNNDSVFVLTSLSTWDATEYIKNKGDITDMNGRGYFLNPDGTIYYECMFNYMDLEYYNGPYELNEKILPALSKFIKGEIEVDLLLCLYRKTLLDVAADDVLLKNWYSSEKLKELGVI